MSPVRELRYYVNAPKWLGLLAISGGFTAIGWWALKSSDPLLGWVALSFFGLCTVVVVATLSFSFLLRKPILRFTDAGVSSSSPLTPWRHTDVPWDDVASIGIRAQTTGHTTAYWLTIAARHPERYGSKRAQRFAANWSPALKDVVITALLGWIFFRASATRRQRMLEQIKTTFAPEIIRYSVWVDEQLRPM